MELEAEEIERYGKDYTRFKGKRYMLKVGHGGTLDSFAEGVMVVGLGRSCKLLSRYTEHTDKEYRVVCKLGETTDTLDPEGVVLERAPWEHVRREDLEQALERFCGRVNQVAPAFSARKIHGKRYSDLAIKARDTANPLLQPEAKPVTIHSLKLLDFDPPKYTISVVCSSGTYMRSLARDIAEAVGSVGFALEVIRTRQGEFSEGNCLQEQDWTVEKIRDYIREHQTYKLNPHSVQSS